MGGKRHGGQKTGGQKAGGQKVWGAKGWRAKGRGAKDQGAKDWGAKDRGAKILSPSFPSAQHHLTLFAYWYHEGLHMWPIQVVPMKAGLYDTHANCISDTCWLIGPPGVLLISFSFFE